jgi:hypothetical protein
MFYTFFITINQSEHFEREGVQCADPHFKAKKVLAMNSEIPLFMETH